MEIIKGERPQMLPEIPEIFQKLIRGCWEKDAKKRPEIEKIYGDVNKEFIKIYENEELMLKYENKRATEFLEIPKSPYPTHHTSSASGMPPIESLTINDYTFIINKNCTHCTSSSLRYGRENDNEKVMYDVTNKSSDVNYLSFSLLLLKKKMTKKVQQTRFNSHFIFKISGTSKFYSS
ncbi:13333_t:CDS:1 [Rhizophagus irregularis]|nr:13333_t:CDS:1 [Rhizophagus irregularis]